MRPTSNSERFLLALLGCVVLGGLAFFGYKALDQKQQALNLARASLKADQAEAQVDLQKKDLWMQRQAWIKAHEPAFGDEGDTRAQVLNAVVKGARDHHLEILEQTLGGVQHGPGGARVNAEVKIKGSMEGLCRWLADLQKPESFYAVGLFSLKADQDQKSMVCTLQVARYFRENSP
jgi:hypothetical protein